MWLALGLGVLLVLAGWPLAPALLDAMGASEAVRPHALTYLRVSLLGLPAMLLVLAATGVLRGLQDTRTPFVVSVASALGNAVLSATLVLGLGFGVGGSAAATVVAQVGAAAAYLAVLAPALRREGVRLRPDLPGVRRRRRRACTCCCAPPPCGQRSCSPRWSRRRWGTRSWPPTTSCSWSGRCSRWSWTPSPSPRRR
jgi:O-antigen/teichoic acid export membrane protein